MGVLENKIAIVTGAGRGIGREIALDFAREGARVVVNDLGGAADGRGASRVADEAVKEIEALGGEAVPNGDSVATVEGGRRIFQAALDAFGACDVLVNNAGILRDKSFANLSEAQWDAVIQVHLKGAFCVTQPVFRWMKENGRGGVIVNTASSSGLGGSFGQTNYGAAKAGGIRGRPRRLERRPQRLDEIALLGERGDQRSRRRLDRAVAHERPPRRRPSRCVSINPS